MPAAGTAALALLSQPWRSQPPSPKGASVQVVHEDAWSLWPSGWTRLLLGRQQICVSALRDRP